MKNFIEINRAFVATKNFGQINRALAAKKKLNFLKLLVLAGVLMMSIPQAWAGTGYTLDYPYIYYYNDAGWSDAQVIVGRDWTDWNRSDVYPMTAVSGTKLYYREVACKWDDNYNEICILTGASAWGGEDNNIRTRWGYATAHADNDKLNYRMDYHRTYLWDGKSADPFIVVNSTNTTGGYANLNYSQTVKKYTCVNGTSYSAASVNSGTVTIEPYKMTAHGTASKASNKGTINTAGTTSVSKDAAYTGEVELTATANTGYVFMGWFDAENGGDAVKTSSTYKYNAPRSTKTVYARFAPKFTVGKRLYLNLDSFTSWKNDGARFAACFGNATTQTWVNCTLLSGNTYYVDVPSGSWGYVIFCRMGSSATNAWSNRLNQAPDLMPYSTYNCAKITGWSAGSWCRYSQNPVIIRSHNDWDPENADAMSISGNTCTKSLAFSAHSTYQVKILDGATEYGLNEMVVTSPISDYTIKSGEYQLRVATAGAGDYTFTYDKSNQNLSIGYPTVTHPSVDYCYIIKYSWSTPRLHIWSSSTASSTSSVTTGPILYNYVSIQGTNYYYVAPGDYANFLVSDNGDASNRTGDLTSSEGYGKYRHNSSGWKWSNWSFTVALTEQVTTTSAPSDPTVQFNGTAPSDITAPVCGFYTFGGYYPQEGGGTNQVITNAGKWNASVSGYTDGSKKWIHNGGTATLYAKWTQSITLNANGGSANTTASAVWKAAGPFAPAATQTYSGHTLVDYRTSDGTSVLTAAGAFSSTNVSDASSVAYVTSGKWAHNAATTLYAHWKCNTPASITCSDNVVTIDVPNATTVHYTIDNSTPSGSSPTYDPSNKPVIGSNVTVKAIAIQSGCTDSEVASQAVTYTPVYDVTPSLTNVSKSTGDETVLENHAYTATFTANTGYTLPTTITVTINASTATVSTDYTWSISAGVGTLSIPVDKIDGNVVITIAGDAKTYTINLDANGGTGSPTSVTATYDSSNLSAEVTSPKKANYLFAGWYDAETEDNGSGTQVIDANGALIANVTSYTGAGGIWNKDAGTTLHAKWLSLAEDIAGCWDDGTWKCGEIAGLAIPKPGMTTWNTSTNWPNNTVPDINTKVVLSTNMTIDADHAKAKEIVLNGVTLTVSANKGLEVAGTITKADGSAPTASDLTLASGAAGNAALIFDNSNSAAATVQMYSIAAAPQGSTWSWQYAAAPAAVSALYNYYGGYLYKWTNSGWSSVGGSDNMELFAGYCVSYPTSGHTFSIEGALATETVVNIPVADGKNWVVGNSWTAPIQIAQMTAADFVNLEATVYLFNTGMDADGSGGTGTAAGTYRAVTPASAAAGSPSVISSMQGFYVKNTSGNDGTFSLSYSKHVRPSGGRGIANGAMYAPKRLTEVVPDKMKIVVEGSRYNSDVLLFAREGFSMGYDTCWDGRNINDPGVGPLLYTLREDGTKDAISAIPTYEGAVIGFEAGEDDEYTFRFTYDGEDNWYLNDTKMNQSTLITSENVYRFDVSSDDKTRFVISATPCNAPAVTTGVGETNDGAAARKQMIDGMLYIVRSGRIYNAEGILLR